MNEFYIGKQAEAMSYLSIIINQDLSPKMQLLYIDNLREYFDCDTAKNYIPSLQKIIDIQTHLVKNLPDVEQNYHKRGISKLFNK